MASFATRVVQIETPVEHHPDADRLSIVRIAGYLCISGKLPDGSHRYKEGDYVVYIPEAAVVPEPILRALDFWGVNKKTGLPSGMLDGTNGDRVKARRLRGIFSQGILYPVEKGPNGLFVSVPLYNGDELLGYTDTVVTPGEDISGLLHITKYEPPVPVHMAGEVCNLFGVPYKYDFESVQSVTDLFDVGEEVVATEKLHGTFFQAGYVPGLENPECFGGGDFFVTSKGIGNRGLAFKDNANNDGNLYVKTLRQMIADGVTDRMKTISDGKTIRIFGEVFGTGVQDLHYGMKQASFRLFDIMIGDEFLTPEEMGKVAFALGIPVVPVLYSGPYDTDALVAVRDGKDTLSNSHVREGIVIRSATGARHPLHGRKIGKWISPDYLTRGNKNATEFN